MIQDEEGRMRSNGLKLRKFGLNKDLHKYCFVNIVKGEWNGRRIHVINANNRKKFDKIMNSKGSC